MIHLRYIDENKVDINFKVNDWDAVYSIAEGLLSSPVTIDYLDYIDGDEVGTFNLHTFTKC